MRGLAVNDQVIVELNVRHRKDGVAVQQLIETSAGRHTAHHNVDESGTGRVEFFCTPLATKCLSVEKTEIRGQWRTLSRRRGRAGES